MIGYTSIRHDITAKKDFEEQHLILLEQSKMASLGEMLSNIAHQWRQPLNLISLASVNLKLKKERGKLNDEIIDQTIERIDNATSYLSDTIDTFRNFIKDDKTPIDTILQESIKQALSIIDMTLKSNNIKLLNKIDYSKKTHIKLVEGELPQVIINILNNAKDILQERDIKDPLIVLETYIVSENKKDTAVITIEDNGGGIPKEILPKIFDPYFTTKHKAQGTGLGLHMSYKIITESLGGSLYVKNTKNGAKFFIELPIKNKP